MTMDAKRSPTVSVAMTASDVAEVAESVMRLGVLAAGADDRGAAMTSSEDPADCSGAWLRYPS